MARCIFVAVPVVILACRPATGQEYAAFFEAPVFSGSAAGTPMTNGFGGGGQDGWYNPDTGGDDYQVFTYAGNPHGFEPNVWGQAQFVAGRSTGANQPAQAQHDMSAGGMGWFTRWDVAAKRDGVLPATLELGSFSLQPLQGAISWQAVFSWTNASAQAWQCTFTVYDAAGQQISPPLGPLPSAGWSGLQDIVPARHRRIAREHRRLGLL
jgi:hypothetical protein